MILEIFDRHTTITGKLIKMAEEKKKCLGKEISMDVKDSFFDDPFFRDWWNDFDAPMKDKTLQRQISGRFFGYVQLSVIL